MTVVAGLWRSHHTTSGTRTTTWSSSSSGSRSPRSATGRRGYSDQTGAALDTAGPVR